jgi:hypothetical protein
MFQNEKEKPTQCHNGLDHHDTGFVIWILTIAKLLYEKIRKNTEDKLMSTYEG